MSDPGKVRALRYRRHRAGDHSLCSELRCPSVSTPVRELRDPLALAAPGQQLWSEMTKDGPLGPMASVLLLEACRIADRLDQLDRQLKGDDWLRFRVRDEEGAEVVVYVDRVLQEAREQATALKGLVVELRQTTAKQQPQKEKAGGGLADLTARIAAKRAATS